MIRRSVALLLALVVFASVNAAALVSASAQPALPGSTLVTDVTVQQETAQLHSFGHFNPTGGAAVAAHDTGNPELLFYLGTDAVSNELTGLTRPLAAIHPAGTFVAALEPSQLVANLEPAASAGVTAVTNGANSIESMALTQIAGFDPAGGFAVSDPQSSAPALFYYSGISDTTLVGIESPDAASLALSSSVVALDPAVVFPLVVDPPPIAVIAPDPDPITVDPSPVGPVTVAPLDPDPVIVDGPDLAPVVVDPPPVTQPGINPDAVIADPPPIYVDGPDPAPVVADPPPVTKPGIDPSPVIADPRPIYIDGPDPAPVVIDPPPVRPIYVGPPPLPPACIPLSRLSEILEQLDPTGPVNDVLFFIQSLLEEPPPIVIDHDVIGQVQDLLAGILEGSTAAGTAAPAGIEEAIIYLGLLDASSQASVMTVGVADICLEFSDLPDFYFPGIDQPAVIVDPQPVPDVNQDPAPVIVDPQPIPGATLDPAAVIIDLQPVPDVSHDLAPVVVDPQPIPGTTLDPAAVIIDPQPVPDANHDLAPLVVDPQPIPGVTQNPATVIVDPQPVPDVVVTPPQVCTSAADPFGPVCTIPAIDAPPVSVDLPGACTVTGSAAGSCTIDPSPVARIDPSNPPPVPGGVPVPVPIPVPDSSLICGDRTSNQEADVEGPALDGVADIAVESRSCLPEPGPVVSDDDRFALVAAQVPEFGGAYVDESANTLYVLLTVPTVAAAERAQFALEEQFRDGLAQLTVAVLPATYTFAELYAWAELLDDAVLSNIDDVVFTDIDDRKNVLTVAVQDANISKALVEKEAVELGIPLSAVDVIQHFPLNLNASLQDEVRPLTGAVQVTHRVAGGLGVCSQFITMRAKTFTRGFITNSHCSGAMGAVDGSEYYNAEPEPFEVLDKTVGYEHLDPPFFTGWNDSACPREAVCRYSDANWSRPHLDKSQYDRGRIAWADRGSPEWDGNKIHVLEAGRVMVGRSVAKVGRTTGYTSGEISRGCVKVVVRDDGEIVFDENGRKRMLLCQKLTDYVSTGGDSGGPVVRARGANQKFVGIHWASGKTATGAPVGVFSPWDMIEAELGDMFVCLEGRGC